MPLLSSLSAALDALSTSATAFLLESLPLLLHLYWLLAAGAVLFTLLPWDIAPGFKAAVKLSAARGKTMETAPTATKKNEANASPSPSRKRSRSRSRSRGSAGGGSGSSSGGGGGGGSRPTSAPPSSSPPLGPFLSSLTVPQGWFLHFYALGSVAASAVLGAALRGGTNGGGGGGKSFSSNSSLSPPLPASSVAALALLLLHVLRRWAECSWQASWPSGARMHAVAYAFGMSYYAVLPLSLLPSGAFGAAAAAVRDGRRGEEAKGAGAAVASFLSKKLGLVSSSSAPSPLQHPASLVLAAFSSLGPLRLAGVAVFAAGSLLQALSHAALAALQRRAAAAKRQYLAPSADAGDSRLLSLCACPHYLGEIVIYAGLAMVAAGWWGGVPSFPSSSSSSAPWSLLSSPSRPSPSSSSSWRSSSSPPPSSSSSSSSTSAGVLPLLVLVWVSVNLVLASAECKRWYRRRFPREFPEARAALVPGVF